MLILTTGNFWEGTLIREVVIYILQSNNNLAKNTFHPNPQLYICIMHSSTVSVAHYGVSDTACNELKAVAALENFHEHVVVVF